MLKLGKNSYVTEDCRAKALRGCAGARGNFIQGDYPQLSNMPFHHGDLMSQVLSGPKKLNQVVVVIQRHSDDQNIDRSSSMPSANPAINKTNIGVDDATAVSTTFASFFSTSEFNERFLV